MPSQATTSSETENETPNAATPGTPVFNSLRVDLRRNSMPRQSNKWLPSNKAAFSLARKLAAEFVGTFILIFGATAASIVSQKYPGAVTLIGNAACAGLAVMAVIVSAGHISGAHLNPSLTIAFAVFRHFPWAQVPAYIVAQVSASICASFALKGIYHPFLSGGVTTAQAFLVEFVITFNLTFVVTAVATDKRAVGNLAGIAVGATLMLNILIAGRVATEWGIDEPCPNSGARRSCR